MPTYIKTMSFGPTSGGKTITSEKIDPLINGILSKIQNESGKILDIKVTSAALTQGNYVSTFLIVYDASQPTD